MPSPKPEWFTVVGDNYDLFDLTTKIITVLTPQEMRPNSGGPPILQNIYSVIAF